MTQKPVSIVGSYWSPFVRKVLVCLALKRIDYVIDPIVPSYSSSDCSRENPIHSVVVFGDEAVTITDSTVICEYLEERYPQYPLYPTTSRWRARARWLEEYADSRLCEVFLFRLFNEQVTKPRVRGEQADPAVVARALDIEAPQILDYLEHEYTGIASFLYGELGIADIAVASFLRNADLAGFSVDGARWPAMHGLATRALQHPAFVALRKFEELCLHTPPQEQREALVAAGAPVSLQSFAAIASKRGSQAN